MMSKLYCLAFFLMPFVCAAQTTAHYSQKNAYPMKDLERLSALNKQFIQNFVTQNAEAHDKIIHKDFVCINGNGSLTQRADYIKNWATGYSNSGYLTFSYTDELIRIFGNMALVRSKTVYTKNVEGKTIEGGTIYTDTYVKENGEWLCVQAQITPIK